MIIEQIVNAKLNGDKILELGNFDDERLPNSITRLPDLEELIIGNYYDYKEEMDRSGGKCSLKELPKDLGNLKNLKKLVLSGGEDFNNFTQIEDFSPIWELKNLEVLILQSANIKSIHRISELKKLKHLSLDLSLIHI